MPASRKIEKQYVLIVEGKDEINFFQAALRGMGQEDVQLLDIGGKDKIKTDLELVAQDLKDRPLQIKSIGIIRDADQDPAAALQSVQDALKKWGLPVPVRVMEPAGTNPSIRIMIVPDTKHKGSLETLCIKSVADDPAMECVEEYIECLKKKGCEIPVNPDKAKAYSFIAACKPPEDEIGVAAQKGYWNLDSPAFDELKKFIRGVAGGLPANSRKKRGNKGKK